MKTKGPRSTHSGERRAGHSEGAAVLGRGGLAGTTVPAPWFQTRSLQDCEKMHLCRVSHTVCGILLWRPEVTETGRPTCQGGRREHAVFNSLLARFVTCIRRYLVCGSQLLPHLHPQMLELDPGFGPSQVRCKPRRIWYIHGPRHCLSYEAEQEGRAEGSEVICQGSCPIPSSCLHRVGTVREGQQDPGPRVDPGSALSPLCVTTLELAAPRLPQW